MSEFTAHILRRDDYTHQQRLPGLTFTPLSWSGNWHGGPKEALIDVTGSEIDLVRLFDMLRCGISVVNADGTIVWTGMIWGITITLGARRYSFSMDDVHNRVSVSYIALSADGMMESYDSDWIEDAGSQTIYGTREIKISMADEADADLADQRAAMELDNRRLPFVTRTSGDGSHSARLSCVGLTKELDDSYHDDERGRTEYDPGGGIDHPIGWQTTDDDAALAYLAGAYSSFNDKLPPIPPNSQFSLTSTLSNNRTFTVVSRATEESTTYSGSDFWFDATDDVHDRAEGLTFLGRGQFARIAGSSLNDGDWIVNNVGADHISVYPASIVDEDGGGVTGTVEGAAYLRVDSVLANEYPNAGTNFVVKVIGEQIDQLVNIGAKGGGPLWKVAIPVAKVGTPTDTLKVAIYADSGGSFGALIDSGTLSASDVGAGKTMTWCEMDNAGDTTISDSTSYHIVVSRTGAFSATNYWILDIIEDTEDGTDSNIYEETARYYDGASWGTRPRDTSLPFRIWTGVDVSEQIKKVIDAYSVNIAGSYVADQAGILVNPYYDGDRRALDIVQSLLKIGRNDGYGLILDVVPDRRIIIRRQLQEWEHKRIGIGMDGQPITTVGGAVAPGVMFYGEWARDSGAPPPSSSISSLTPIFIAEMEYNAGRDHYTIRPPGARDLFDLGYRDG